MEGSVERKKKDQPPNFTNTKVYVDDEGKGTDFVSAAKSVLDGYTQLSGTFNADQANIAQKYNLDENIKQIAIYQIIQGDVYGNVTQAIGSEVHFSQQITDSFKIAYNIVENKDNISNEEKEEIIKNLKVLEGKLQSKKDLDEIPSSAPMKWLKQNANWIIQAIIKVVMKGLDIAYKT